MPYLDEPIVAIATPPGHGGVGIVRLSGSEVLELAKKISHKTTIKARFAYFVTCFDEQEQVIDQGLLIYFKAPHSYTGEDVVEFQLHGSPWILAEILRVTQIYGARLARPGEFTERAFLNNKIDLLQAEAVADLIQAQSATAAKMASRTLQGRFSEYVQQLEQDLKQLRMFVEATIDFSEEAIEWLEQHQWQQRLLNLQEKVTIIRKQAYQGQVLQDGLCLVLLGRPNVGKSTLMNVFSEKDVAIVTDIAGTTRDLMREQILLDDIPLTIVDTAGLRTTTDKIEQEGIKRAWAALEHADLVLYLHDMSQDKAIEDDLFAEFKQRLPEHVPVIHVINKMDTLVDSPEDFSEFLQISAKHRQGIEALKLAIKSKLGIQGQESDFIARKRHVSIFEQIEKEISHTIEQFDVHQAPELLAEDLRHIQTLLAQVTGEFTADDLLGEIFSNFCIGK